MTAPSWLPNWQDASHYPSHATMKQWAWQFLRRNKEYQRLWDELIAPYIKPDGTFDDDASMVGYERQKQFGKITDCKGLMPATYFLEQFKIKRLVAPSNSNAVAFFQTTGIKTLSTLQPDKTIAVQTKVDARNIYVNFRLDLPLAPQLKDASIFLKRRAQFIKQKHKIPIIQELRDSSSHFPIYLRLLDAAECSAKVEQMAAVIYAGEPDDYPDYRVRQKVRRNLKHAMKLRDADYLLIPLVNEK